MRSRLLVAFLIPLAVVFVVMGAAYARSIAHNAQQEFFADQHGDVLVFVTFARQALRADDPSLVEGELERYRQLYGVRAAVLDRSGEPWVTTGLDVLALDDRSMQHVHEALAGRTGDAPRAVLPWSSSDMVIAEPVFDEGDMIGVVVTSSNVDVLRGQVARQWVLIGLGAILAMAVGLVVVARLASWVLRPVQQVDRAMTEVWHGNTEARIADETGPPEVRRMISVFNGMAEEVEHVIHRQQEFVLNAPHELRNPLNALLVRIEHLATGLSEGWAKDVEETREEGRRMARILDRLLKLANSHDVVLAPKTVDLVELVERRVEAWRDVSEQQRVSLDLTVARPVQCAADEIAIESAFDAVLDNAIKFSPPGQTVDVSVTNGNETAAVAVRDRGTGLEAHEFGKVTDRFWRSPDHQNAPGSGLGLAIATELLTSCGGEIDIGPADGGGLIVSLRVPVGKQT